VLGLIASLTLLAFAAMGLVSIAAADGPVEVANANPDWVELDRVYGTYTSQWNGMVDRELCRHYGTFAGVWYTDFAAR
jgi:hypothetical protein